MIKSRPGVLEVFLQPGEWYFGDENTRLRTTLGSCVAIVLWHPQRRLGGMCHYMLPSRGKRGDMPLSGRYGDEAMELLLDEVKRCRTQLSDYELKLFGGANMFSAETRRQDDVPARNVAFARRLLRQHGLQAKAESLGGFGYRQLIFDIADGDVWMRQGASHVRQDGNGP
jgi:chemotaxis protein CheD